MNPSTVSSHKNTIYKGHAREAKLRYDLQKIIKVSLRYKQPFERTVKLLKRRLLQVGPAMKDSSKQYLIHMLLYLTEPSYWTQSRHTSLWTLITTHYKEIFIKGSTHFRPRYVNTMEEHNSHFIYPPIKPEQPDYHIESLSQMAYRLNKTDTSFYDPLLTQFMEKLIKEEYELKNGDVEESGYEVCMIGNSCWTPMEKERFFIGLQRCGKHDIAGICRRIGNTKRECEIAEYIYILETASRELPRSKEEEWEDKLYTAREMTPAYQIQELRMSSVLSDKLEEDAYFKHQALLQAKPDELKQAEELIQVLEATNMSKLFSNRCDMNLFGSTLIIMNRLVRKFVKDILRAVLTEMLNEGYKTVTTTRVNHALLKRRHFYRSFMLNKPDTRLSEMPILSILQKHSTSVIQNPLEITASLQHKLRSISMLQKDIQEEKSVVQKDVQEEESTLQKDVEGEESTLQKDVEGEEFMLQKDIEGDEFMLEKDVQEEDSLDGEESMLQKDVHESGEEEDKCTREETEMDDVKEDEEIMRLIDHDEYRNELIIKEDIVLRRLDEDETFTDTSDESSDEEEVTLRPLKMSYMEVDQVVDENWLSEEEEEDIEEDTELEKILCKMDNDFEQKECEENGYLHSSLFDMEDI
ncbi:hypothetical protein BDB01DRAFT_895804 [Pilobolus umbonatus]|nr:hypothetical protein BDB01DRAFT_895804 [Pilobolus umbonatus]